MRGAVSAPTLHHDGRGGSDRDGGAKMTGMGKVEVDKVQKKQNRAETRFLHLGKRHLRNFELTNSPK